MTIYWFCTYNCRIIFPYNFQLYTWWYCVACIRPLGCLHRISIPSIMLLQMHDFWIVEWANVHMDSIGLHSHRHKYKMSRAHFWDKKRKYTINQQTKAKSTLYMNNESSLFDMGFIPFSSSHSFKIFNNTMYTNNFIGIKKCCWISVPFSQALLRFTQLF